MLIECTDTTTSLDFLDDQLMGCLVFQKAITEHLKDHDNTHDLIIKLPFVSQKLINYKNHLVSNTTSEYNKDDIEFAKYIQDYNYLSVIIENWTYDKCHDTINQYMYYLIIEYNLTHKLIRQISRYLEHFMDNLEFMHYHELPDAPFNQMGAVELEYSLVHFPRVQLPGITTVYINLCVAAYTTLGDAILEQIASNEFCCPYILQEACMKVPKIKLTETFKQMQKIQEKQQKI